MSIPPLLGAAENAGLIELVRKHLEWPEYVHVLLNPLPVYGLALGILALIIAIALRSRPAQITALAIVLFSALSTWPVVEFGEKGYDRVESTSDKVGYVWLDAHAQRGKRYAFVFYILAGIATVALALPFFLPKTGTPLSIVTLLASIVTLGFGIWIAYAGGQVRHKEFRDGTVPPEKPGGYEKMAD